MKNRNNDGTHILLGRQAGRRSSKYNLVGPFILDATPQYILSISPMFQYHYCPPRHLRFHHTHTIIRKGQPILSRWLLLLSSVTVVLVADIVCSFILFLSRKYVPPLSSWKCKNPHCCGCHLGNYTSISSRLGTGD